ncbi:MAG: class I SAM-dependent methyltransferase [Pirellulales bacterium]|nr:class I SAM-dependent methyltransferase [Pirellulales bacterium]
MREKHGALDSGANGYRLQSYFLREQEILLAEVGAADTVVDLACGSGLMIQPLVLAGNGRRVLGVDYNEIACNDARANQLNVIRGDVFKLPFAADSVDRIINSQFLNQQTPENSRHFIREVHRVLKPGGRLIMIWRNDRAVIHKLAVLVYSVIDKLTGRPAFPYYDNYIEDLAGAARSLGFTEIKKFLTFPLLRWQFHDLESPAARVFGASCFLVLEKR